MPNQHKPSGRVLAGCSAILLLIAVWAALIAGLARLVGQWPVLIQAAFYLFTGLVWIVPLKPLVRWMQTGAVRNGSNGPGRD